MARPCVCGKVPRRGRGLPSPACGHLWPAPGRRSARRSPCSTRMLEDCCSRGPEGSFRRASHGSTGSAGRGHVCVRQGAGFRVQHASPAWVRASSAGPSAAPAHRRGHDPALRHAVNDGQVGGRRGPSFHRMAAPRAAGAPTAADHRSIGPSPMDRRWTAVERSIARPRRWTDRGRAMDRWTHAAIASNDEPRRSALGSLDAAAAARVSLLEPPPPGAASRFRVVACERLSRFRVSRPSPRGLSGPGTAVLIMGRRRDDQRAPAGRRGPGQPAPGPCSGARRGCSRMNSHFAQVGT